MENNDVRIWRELMRAEKSRGVTYVDLAGAEPSLVPKLRKTCYAKMPLDSIATDGLKKITRTVISSKYYHEALTKEVMPCRSFGWWECSSVSVREV